MNKVNLQSLSTGNQLLAEFHLELINLMDAFKSNSYAENFLNNFLKMFLDNKHKTEEKVITRPNKPLFLVLPDLGPLPLQTNTKPRKSFQAIFNCCKLQIVFKSQNKLVNKFRFKNRIPKQLTSGRDL